MRLQGGQPHIYLFRNFIDGGLQPQPVTMSVYGVEHFVSQISIRHRGAGEE